MAAQREAESLHMRWGFRQPHEPPVPGAERGQERCRVGTQPGPLALSRLLKTLTCIFVTEWSWTHPFHLCHQQISDSDIRQRIAVFMEAACRCLKTRSLKHGLGAGDRQNFRGTLDSDYLVHGLILLLINVRLWASHVTSLGICNTGMVAACL